MDSLLTEKIIKENNLKNDDFIINSVEENIDNQTLRRMENLDYTYYGMKKLTNVKDLFNYNLLGLKMQKQILNEINPSTGTSISYFILTFGLINQKIKTSEQRSNMHLILRNKNQMIFNLMQLLYKSNIELKQRNKNISEYIVDLENNFFNLFQDYDYSH
jgi:cephalosporin hydroxylase